MNAVAILGQKLREIAEATASRDGFGCAKLVIFANSGRQQLVPKDQTPPGIDRRSIVYLQGMAATKLDKNRKPTTLVVARQANVTIDEYKQLQEVRVQIQLEDGVAYDPDTFRQSRPAR